MSSKKVTKNSAEAKRIESVHGFSKASKVRDDRLKDEANREIRPAAGSDAVDSTKRRGSAPATKKKVSMKRRSPAAGS